MILKVITHSKILLNKDCRYILFRNEDGECGILDNHVPIVLMGKSGFLKVEYKDGSFEYVVYRNGIFKFRKNEAVLLANLGSKNSDMKKAMSELDKIISERQTISKKETLDFSKLEKELHDNIKKAKAGRI